VCVCVCVFVYVMDGGGAMSIFLNRTGVCVCAAWLLQGAGGVVVEICRRKKGRGNKLKMGRIDR
jgi:hypothetical protein